MASKNLVIEESGTQLIPWDHICCGLSVQTIGSRFAPKSYLKLCESIGFPKLKSTLNKANHVFEADITTELSDRQIVLSKHLIKSSESLEKRNSQMIFNIDDKQLPKYETKLREKDFRNKFIDSQLFSNEKSDQIIEQLLEEMKNEFLLANKHSIIDYVLTIDNKFIKEPLFCVKSLSDGFDCVKQINSLSNFRCNPTLRQIVEIWDKKYRNIDIFDFYLPKNLDSNEFETKIAQNCQQMNFRLKYEWISDCNQILLNDCPKLINYDCIKNKTFFDSIASLMSQLFRELILKNLENWINILSDNFNKTNPLFKINIKCKSRGNPYFVPSIKKLNQILSFPLNYLLEANKDIDRVENNLILLKSKRTPSKFIFNVQITDVDIKKYHDQIVSFVDSIDFHHIIGKYEKQFTDKNSRIMDNFEKFINASKDADNIFEACKFNISNLIMSKNNLNIGIFEINFHEFKNHVRKRMENKVNKIFSYQLIQFISLARQVCDKLSSFEAELRAPVHSCNDLMTNMKQMKSIHSNFNLLLFDIQFIENNWNSIAENGTKLSVINEIDFEVLHRIHYLPQKIQISFNERKEELNQIKRKFEDKLQKSMDSLEYKTKNLAKVLDNFCKKKISSHFENISDNCSELKDIKDLLNQFSQQYQEISDEKNVLQLIGTEFPLLDQLIERTRSLSDIWGTALLFQKTQNQCMSESLRSLDVENIRQGIDNLLSSCNQMNTTFKTNDLLSNVNTLQTNIETFKTNYIPLIEVLSSPVLRERHWIQINEIIGQKIFWSLSSTLSEVISDNNPNKYIQQIKNLGKIANKEYELEMLLHKIQNQWLDNWPEDALEIVANKYLEEEEGLPFLIRQKCAKGFKFIYLVSIDFFKEEIEVDSPFCVTPPMFIEMILTFKHHLKEKLKQLSSERNRYLEAIEKLNSVVNSLKTMRNQMINDFQPILLMSFVETEYSMIRIERETLKIEIQTEVMAADEALANRLAAGSQQIKDECYRELIHTIPFIKSAINALNTLKSEDITFLRSMKCPPPAVRHVLEAVCILNDYKPDRRPDPKTKQMIDDYWSSSLRMISDVRFLDKLKNFDRNHIQRNSIELIRKKYLHSEYFEATTLKRVSKACEGLSNWVRAIDIYDRLITVIQPKRKKLKESETESQEILKILDNRQKELRNASDLLQQLNDKFSLVSKKKRELDHNRDKSHSKLVRLKNIVSELKTKTIEFKQIDEKLKVEEYQIVPQLVLSSALITYTCALTSQKRWNLMNKWRNYLENECNFSFNKEFSFLDVLGDNSRILLWTESGLPYNQFDIENAIICHISRRFPVIIDRNKEINKWLNRLYPNLIRINCESENNNNLLIERVEAIERGEPFLIENFSNISTNHIITQLIESNLLREEKSELFRLTDGMGGLFPTFRGLICSQSISDLSPKLLTKICLIDWNTSPEIWSDVNDIRNKYISDLRSDIERKTQFVVEENRFIETLFKEKFSDSFI